MSWRDGKSVLRFESEGIPSVEEIQRRLKEKEKAPVSSAAHSLMLLCRSGDIDTERRMLRKGERREWGESS